MSKVKTLEALLTPKLTTIKCLQLFTSFQFGNLLLNKLTLDKFSFQELEDGFRVESTTLTPNTFFIIPKHFCIVEYNK